MRVKKTVLVLLLLTLLSSVPLSAVQGQSTYIIINETGVVGSDSIIQDGNVFTVIEPIRKPIKIEIDDIVLDGGENKMEIVSSYDAITLIGRNNVVLHNIYVKTARNGIVLEASTGCTIQDSLIEGCNTDGIRLTDASTNNLIQNNTMIGNERVGVVLRKQSNDNTISGNTINENLVGIAFTDSHRNGVFDNRINMNTIDGIHSDASNENLIHHNEANENDQGLALKDGSTGNLVYENVFNLNLDNGIDVDDSNDNRVFDNEMGFNVDYGIDVDVCTLNRFYQNSIHDNRGGIDFDQAEGNFVYSNNFVDNRNQVTYDSEENIWNSSSSVGGNYWSDYTGEDLNGDGYGDSPRYFRSIIIGGVETIDTDNLDYYPLMEPFRRTVEITCLVEPLKIIEEESVVISGKVSPVPESEISVSLIIIGPDGSESDSLLTDLNGEYSLQFTPGKAGEWSVTASWDGNTKYHGDASDSEEFNVEAAEIITPTEPDEPAPPEFIKTTIEELELVSNFMFNGDLEVTGVLVSADNEKLFDQDVKITWESDSGTVLRGDTVKTNGVGMFSTTFILDQTGGTYYVKCTFEGNSNYEGTTKYYPTEFNVGEPRGGIPGMGIESVMAGMLLLYIILLTRRMGSRGLNIKYIT